MAVKVLIMLLFVIKIIIAKIFLLNANLVIVVEGLFL